ncbi:hypothetical protein LSM04_000787 [Trypanosoma melophagium]|uniref:uncharacterized protein n=1 Tax=Trypanosoma melophagium TaxID=715481 RepID=UPI00351A7DE2|nr:hypothetical protein LSM04_000787 [Trypanosoma melophagium]
MLSPEEKTRIGAAIKEFEVYMSKLYPDIVQLDFSYVGKDPIVLRDKIKSISDAREIKDIQILALLTGQRGTNYDAIIRAASADTAAKLRSVTRTASSVLIRIKTCSSDYTRYTLKDMAYAYPECLLFGQIQASKGSLRALWNVISNPLMILAGLSAEDILQNSREFCDKFRLYNPEGFLSMKRTQINSIDRWKSRIHPAFINKLLELINQKDSRITELLRQLGQKLSPTSEVKEAHENECNTLNKQGTDLMQNP